jgi:hypothetical protein
VEHHNLYSVKETYKGLISNLSSSSDSIWSKVWHKSVPLKVSCLVWRLFHNRLLTRDNLLRRCVLDQNSVHCVGGCGCAESITHLFIECPVFSGVWFGICKWLRISTALQKEGHLHLEQFGGLLCNKKVISSCIRVIWFACIWIIWKAKNDKCFQNKGVSIDKMVDDTKVFSWKWWRFKSKSFAYNIDHWYMDPRACMGVLW